MSAEAKRESQGVKLLDMLRPKRRAARPDDPVVEARPRATSAAGLAFDRIGLTRGAQPLFADFSLVLTEPRIGLVGDNGSGKSTLLRLANGLLAPDGGSVSVNGRDTVRDRKQLHDEIGFVFQNPDHQIIFPTVGEEIAFGLTERGVASDEAKRRAEALLAAHGCAGWAGRAVHELSEGQKQLVCILAVIAPEPAIVLMDEPFSSLDLPLRLSLSARLAALPQQIVMASHDLDLIAGFDRIVWLERGRVAADGPPAEILPRYRAHAEARGRALLTEGAP